jgi:disulfide bond formation protein DsbB
VPAHGRSGDKAPIRGPDITVTAHVIAPKNTIAAALLLAAAGFITSLLIEHVGLLVPCELCLIQRWSVFAAVLFLGVSLRSPGRSLSVSGCAGAVLATLASLAAADEVTSIGV